MIFSEDAILMSLLERSENEDEMKESIMKYVHGGVSQEPTVVP
jgi:hypothetical protein